MPMRDLSAVIAGTVLYALAGAILAESLQGSALGYNGEIKVEVERSGDEIAGIRVISHSDTPGIAEPAFERLTNRILDAQHTRVDAVSGATESSRGFLTAVDGALSSDTDDRTLDATSSSVGQFHSQPLVDGRYRGTFGDGGEQQVGVQFDLRDGELQNLSYRHLVYRGQDYRQMSSSDPLYAVKQQHDQILERLEGEPLSAIERLRNTGELTEDIDGFSGATIRGSKLYSAFRDAMNRGVYTPAEPISFSFEPFADGRYRGTFTDRGEQQISIEFELADNQFRNIRFRHLAYSGTDYRSLQESDALHAVVEQHQEIIDYLNGRPLETISDLYQPAEIISDIDGFSGATVRANKVVSAIMNGLSRNTYTPTDSAVLDVGTPEDGRYRGVYEDGGVQQVSIQFTIQNGHIENLSFRHLSYRNTDYRTLGENDSLYPVLRQHEEILEYLDGQPVEAIISLHNPGEFIPDIDGFSGATIRGNKIFSAIVDGINRGIY